MKTLEKNGFTFKLHDSIVPRSTGIVIYKGDVYIRTRLIPNPEDFEDIIDQQLSLGFLDNVPASPRFDIRKFKDWHTVYGSEDYYVEEVKPFNTDSTINVYATYYEPAIDSVIAFYDLNNLPSCPYELEEEILKKLETVKEKFI